MTFCLLHVPGAAEKDPEEAQRPRAGAGVSASDEGRVLQHQRGQEADGEAGDPGGVAVPHRGLGGGRRPQACTQNDFISAPFYSAPASPIYSERMS